jgi:hypothetical protein
MLEGFTLGSYLTLDQHRDRFRGYLAKFAGILGGSGFRGHQI